MLDVVEDDKVLVASFSGGRTSAYMCKLLKEKYGEDIKFVFMDTGAEHPKTYEFVKAVDKAFNLNLVCLKSVFDTPLGKGNNYEVVNIEDIGYDLSTWEGMLTKYSTPYNPAGGFCTLMLKTNPYYKYCDDTFGKGGYVTWLGIRGDESRRAKERENVRYLMDISDFDKQDILDFWEDQPFDLQIDGDIVGNCVFCIKRGANKIALATRYEPELAQDFIRIVEADTVRRIPERKASYNSMYRGKVSLANIIKTYEDFSDEEIKNTIRGMKADTSACSESCEALTAEEVTDEIM